MPGPPPKRDAERRRRNKDGVQTTTVNLDELVSMDVQIPEPPVRYEIVDEDTGEIHELEEPEWVWHPTAMLLWDSVKRSGQSIFLEPSDWAALYMMCEQLHLALQPRPTVIGEVDGEPVIKYLLLPMPGSTLGAVNKMMSSLMILEGDRRKLRVELERKKQRDAAASGGNVTSISKVRSDRFKKASATAEAERG